MNFYNFSDISAAGNCIEIAELLYNAKISHGRCAATWRGGDKLHRGAGQCGGRRSRFRGHRIAITRDEAGIHRACGKILTCDAGIGVRLELNSESQSQSF